MLTLDRTVYRLGQSFLFVPDPAALLPNLDPTKNNLKMNKIFLSLAIAAAMSACTVTTSTSTTADSKPAAGANTAQSQPAPAAAPADTKLRDDLMSEATEFHKATSNADPAGMVAFATDDYILKAPNGKTITRQEMIDAFDKENVPESVACTEPVLVSSTDNSAVLGYNLVAKLKTGQTATVKMKSTFIKVSPKEWLIKETEATL